MTTSPYTLTGAEFPPPPRTLPDLIKVLWHDTQGTCLFAKRLERGRFIWPSPAEGVVTITPAQLGYLLDHAW